MACAALSLTPAAATSAAPPSGNEVMANLIVPRLDAPGVAGSLTGARREIIASLPAVGRADIAAALKKAAANGTRVFLISRESSARGSGYLLNVSHGPPSLLTYLKSIPTGTPFILVDGSWAAVGQGLDQEGGGAISLVKDAGTLKNLTVWATRITRAGPTARVDIVRLRFPRQATPPRPAR
ncbi:hypothetical protein DESA109040_11360 [Deinococcus saxicola]